MAAIFFGEYNIEAIYPGALGLCNLYAIMRARAEGGEA